MPSLRFYLFVLGVWPLALTACAEIQAATAQPVSVVPAVGIDLGSSSRVPQIAGLAGEGEGYGRTEPGATPMPHGSMTGTNQAAGMPMDHGSMTGMDHGSMIAAMDHGCDERHATMDHGSMPDADEPQRDGGMSHSAKGWMAPRFDDSMPGMDHGSMPGMKMDHGSMPGMNHSSKGGMRIAHSGHTRAHGTGTVNSVDPAAQARSTSVSHAPISA